MKEKLIYLFDLKTDLSIWRKNWFIYLKEKLIIPFFVAELTLNPPEGIIAGPVSEDNFFEWECLITGPDETCFENGVFPAKITFSQVIISFGKTTKLNKIFIARVPYVDFCVIFRITLFHHLKCNLHVTYFIQISTQMDEFVLVYYMHQGMILQGMNRARKDGLPFSQLRKFSFQLFLCLLVGLF